MMASLPLSWNNGILTAKEKLNLCAAKSKIYGRNRALSGSLSSDCFSPLCLSYSSCYKPRSRLLCSNKARLQVNVKENADFQLVKRGRNEPKRKSWLRLRPRIRLLSNRLRRVSIKSILNGITTFLRKNAKRVTLSTSISVVLGLCFLFLKMTAMPVPKVVPYSDLIMSLQSGSVSKVLFEEGTRRIYYNTDSGSAKDIKTGEEKKDSSLSYNSAVESDATVDMAQSNSEARNEVGKLTKARKSSPAWEFSTRKIDHDESYLLGLMRERGTSYSSAPQSALMSMRNMLITVLTLWIPLTPLMWILYRQLSAANSPAKKRKPSNQLVCFEDVEGVDGAKVELMEVSYLLV